MIKKIICILEELLLAVAKRECRKSILHWEKELKTAQERTLFCHTALKMHHNRLYTLKGGT